MNPIVGIGELLWDVYPDGRKVAGGAPFNFAFHCHQLGHPAAIVSRVGDDDLGRELRDRVRELGLGDEYIQTDRKLRTGTVTVALDQDRQPAYTIDTKAAWTGLEWSDAVADLARRAAALCHGTLAVDVASKSGRAVIDKMALRIAQHDGLLVYDLNLRGNAEPDERAVFRSGWLKVNEDELGWLMRRVGESIDDGVPVPDVPTMLELLRIDTKRDDTVLIVTRGAGGAEVFARELRHRERAPRVEVVDTVGAGDAFTAAMVCLHLEGRPLRECARFANHYAARVCEHQGATPRIDRAEVELATFGRVG
jgi:fructokinase